MLALAKALVQGVQDQQGRSDRLLLALASVASAVSYVLLPFQSEPFYPILERNILPGAEVLLPEGSYCNGFGARFENSLTHFRAASLRRRKHSAGALES